MQIIEIHVADDGKLYVGLAPPEESGPDEPAMDMTGMQPAQSVDDALRIAKTLIEQGGQPAPSTGEQGAVESFAAGFQGVRGNTSIGG